MQYNVNPKYTIEMRGDMMKKRYLYTAIIIAILTLVGCAQSTTNDEENQSKNAIDKKEPTEITIEEAKIRAEEIITDLLSLETYATAEEMYEVVNKSMIDADAYLEQLTARGGDPLLEKHKEIEAIFDEEMINKKASGGYQYNGLAYVTAVLSNDEEIFQIVQVELNLQEDEDGVLKAENLDATDITMQHQFEEEYNRRQEHFNQKKEEISEQFERIKDEVTEMQKNQKTPEEMEKQFEAEKKRHKEQFEKNKQ